MYTTFDFAQRNLFLPDSWHNGGHALVKAVVVCNCLGKVIVTADGEGVHGDRRLNEVALLVLLGLQAGEDGPQGALQGGSHSPEGWTHLHPPADENMSNDTGAVQLMTS